MDEDSGYRRLELLEHLFVGEVHLAELVGVEGFSKPVRMWRIRPNLFQTPEARHQLTMELAEAGRLSSYAVGQVLDVWETGDAIALTTEHVSGYSLRAAHVLTAKKGVALPEPAALAIALEVTRALEDAHSAQGLSSKVVHGDLRPEYVLLGYEGTVKVTAIGFARFLPSVCPPGEWRNWEGRCYQPPERNGAAPASPQTDLFSLGLLLLEMLVAHLETQWTNPRELLTNRDVVSPDIGEVITRACADRAGDRYDSATTLAADLHGLLMTRRVTSSTTTLIRCALDELALPGLEAPPTTRSDPQPHPQLEAPTLRTPSDALVFFGRHEVLRTVARALAETRRGAGRAILLRGQPGMGRSQTLREIASRLSDGNRGLIWLPIASHRTDRATRYSAVLRLIAAGAGLPLEQHPKALLDHEQRLHALGIEPRGVAAIRLALETTEGETSTISPAQVPGLLAEVALRCLSSRCRDQTTVVAWDDLHWADDASLGGIYEVLSRLGSMPILVLLTARDDFGLPWSLPINSIEFELEGLEEADVERLVLHGIGRGQFVSPGLLEALTSHSSGNPTRLLETVDLLREENAFDVVNGELLRRGEANAPLPLLEDAIRHRLSRLGDETRAVAVTAAVAGPALGTAAISAATGLTSEIVLGHLEVLADEEGVLLRTIAGFAYRRRSIRRAVLATAKPMLLTTVQRMMARAIVESKDSELTRHASHAAALLEQVGDYQRAAAIREQVASGQAKSGYLRGAAGNYLRALELARAAASLTPTTELNLCVAVGRVAIHSLDLEQAEAPLRDAIALAADLDDPRAEAESRLLLCRLLMRRGKTQEAIEQTQAAMPLAESSEDASIIAQVCAAIAESCQQWGEYGPALVYIERAIQLASDAEDLEQLGHSLLLALLHAVGVGEHDRTADLLDRTKAIAQSMNAPLLSCEIHKAEASMLAFSARHEEALKVNLEGIALAHAHGFEELELVMLHNSGDNHLELDRPREALYYFNESLRRARAARFDRLTEINELFVRFVEATHLELDESLERLRHAIDNAELVGRVWNLTQGHQLLGRALYQRGDQAGAIVQLEEALRLARETSVQFFIDEATRWLQLVR